MSFSVFVAFGANLATLLLILSGAILGMLRIYSYRRFRDLVLLSSLRRGIAKLSKSEVEGLRAYWSPREHGGSKESRSQSIPLSKRVRSVIQHWLDFAHGKRMIGARLKTPLLKAIDNTTIQPGEIIAEVCAGCELATLNIIALVLIKIFSRVGRLPQPFWTRVLYPDEAQRLLQIGKQSIEFLEGFVECKSLDARRQGSPITQRKSFGAFAIALTGAIVLADAAETRNRCAKIALVWHSRTFRGDGYSSGAAAGRVTYDDIHPGAEGCGLWVKLQGGEAKAHPGDYDLRLLDLRSVTLAEAVTEGYVAFVLETTETCFAATEDGASLGCKHVVPQGYVDGDDRSSWTAVTSNGGYRVERQSKGSRIALLDAYVAVISSDKKLLLAHRTSAVRHGQDVYSATAGGLIEPQDRGHGSDIDQFGAPDPAKTVFRRARDEIGTHLDLRLCAPVCVFMCNIRGRSEATRGSGQLVANILYISYVPAKAHEIRNEVWPLSNHFVGSIGQREIIECNFNSPTVAASWAAKNATKLDQHGIISCLYACGMEYGYAETRTAFMDAFCEAPWWAMSPYNDNAVRLTRDPRALAKGVEWLPNIGPAQWRSYWDSMHF